MRTKTLIAFLAALLPCTAQTILVESTFDIDTDGWTAAPRAIRYDTNGFVWVREPSGDGDSTFYFAPPKFLGNKSGVYGGSVQFSMRDNRQGNYGSTTVILRSHERLVRYAAPYPTNGWQDFTIPLGTNGWRIDSDLASRAPTETEMVSLLSDLTELGIRGEYSNSANNETNELDNVRLVAPECVTASALRIYREADQVRLEWPTNACRYWVYTATNVPSTNWIGMEGFLPNTSNGLHSISVFPYSPRQFFELRLAAP